MKVEQDLEVAIEYDLRVSEGGEVVEKSLPDQPLRYVHGKGNILPSLEAQLEGMEIGEEKIVIIPPQNAYGFPDQRNVMEVPKSDLPADVSPALGGKLEMHTPDQKVYVGTVVEVTPDVVFVDFNHPLAGKTLYFSVRIVDIQATGSDSSSKG